MIDTKKFQICAVETVGCQELLGQYEIEVESMRFRD